MDTGTQENNGKGLHGEGVPIPILTENKAGAGRPTLSLSQYRNHVTPHDDGTATVTLNRLDSPLTHVTMLQSDLDLLSDFSWHRRNGNSKEPRGRTARADGGGGPKKLPRWEIYLHDLVCQRHHGPRPSKLHHVEFTNGDSTCLLPDNLQWAHRANQKKTNRHKASSHHKGVSFNSHGGKWRARVRKDSELVHSSSHPTEELAIQARHAAFYAAWGHDDPGCGCTLPFTDMD